MANPILNGQSGQYFICGLFYYSILTIFVKLNKINSLQKGLNHLIKNDRET